MINMLRFAKLSEKAFSPVRGSEKAAGLDLKRTWKKLSVVRVVLDLLESRSAVQLPVVLLAAAAAGEGAPGEETLRGRENTNYHSTHHTGRRDTYMYNKLASCNYGAAKDEKEANWLLTTGGLVEGETSSTSSLFTRNMGAAGGWDLLQHQ
ncbi:hypothetical protein B566_EDAN006344 [Ephemera danica]|nr:hypothetical protein B566_EDAN006344 [Ephemera danica]